VGSNPTSSASRVPAVRQVRHLPTARPHRRTHPETMTSPLDQPLDQPPGAADGALDDEGAMRRALVEAQAALAHDDVPVGAVVLSAGKVVASRHNERERLGDPTAHAEILALRDAAAALGTWRLDDATLVVTLEPCPMCAGALVAARVGRLVFAATDPKAGACGSLYQICADPRLNHELPVTAGVLADEAGALLTGFFASRR
jgi:tRNA(adenine34) deaminase